MHFMPGTMRSLLLSITITMALGSTAALAEDPLCMEENWGGKAYKTRLDYFSMAGTPKQRQAATEQKERPHVEPSSDVAA